MPALHIPEKRKLRIACKWSESREGRFNTWVIFESDPIRCASDPIRNLLEEALRVFIIDEAALICPHAERIEKRLPFFYSRPR